MNPCIVRNLMPAEITNFSYGPSSRFNPDPEAKENGKMQVFLRLQWRKSCKCSFTAVTNGGTAPAAGFPPVTEEENWQVQLSRPL